jgi:hypothetical protein
MNCRATRPSWTPLTKEPAGGRFIDSQNNFIRIETSSVEQSHPTHVLSTVNKCFDSCFEMNRPARQPRSQLLSETSHPARRKQRTPSNKALKVVEKQARARLQLGIKQHAAEKRTCEPHEKLFPESTAAQECVRRKITHMLASGHGHERQTHQAQLIRE